MASQVKKKIGVVGDLSPNPKNPRTITDEKLSMLKASLAEFGDLGAIVFNRETGQLVGGHQRVKLLPKSAKITIEKKYPKPSKTGTVAEGFVVLDGEHFKYREVVWDETKEKAANIAANKGAGEWDLPMLSSWLREIDEYGFDLSLTMFDQTERADLMIPTTNPNFEEGSEEEQGELDQRKPIDCPQCGHRFVLVR